MVLIILHKNYNMDNKNYGHFYKNTNYATLNTDAFWTGYLVH